jgi:hypothetical protein
MRRLLLLVGTLALTLGCKKPKHETVDDTPAGSAKVGHSVTKVGSDAEAGSGMPHAPGSDNAGSGGHLTQVPDSGSAAGSGEGSAKANVTNSPPAGGNGAAAYRDDSGHVHGPGGPVFMGRGMSCDDKHDHCMRKGVWFSVGNIVAGKLYRAVPVFELEKKWWTWRGQEDEAAGKMYMTKLAGNSTLSGGTPIIWFSDETDSHKWADSEYEALTSSRWEAGVVDSMFSAAKVKVKGWNDAVPMDTVRVITEWKTPEAPK